MEDKKLLKLLKRSPSEGMEQLMRQYAGLVYAIVKGRLAGPFCLSSDTEDCVADVFSEFYTSLSSYDPKISSIKSYLAVLARNNATDILRKRRRAALVKDPRSEDEVLEIADDMTVESTLTESELRSQLLLAVKALGEPDSYIIMRKYYVGESSKEIADALKMTVSAVDTRAHRALARLRRTLGGENV